MQLSKPPLLAGRLVLLPPPSSLSPVRVPLHGSTSLVRFEAIEKRPRVRPVCGHQATNRAEPDRPEQFDKSFKYLLASRLPFPSVSSPLLSARSLSCSCFGDMDEASASSLVRKAYRLPSTISMAETFPCALPRQWFDFRRSGPHLKMAMDLDGKGFRDAKKLRAYPRIREAFATGTPIVELEGPGGRRMLLDFLRKAVVLLDDTGAPTHYAALYWVDTDRFLFSPTLYGDMDEDAVRRVFHGSCCGFLAITAVRRCRHREERTLGFLERMKFRAKYLFGWYGAAAADVEAAADGGDLRTNWPLLPAGVAHGRGLHVSAQARPRDR